MRFWVDSGNYPLPVSGLYVVLVYSYNDGDNVSFLFHMMINKFKGNVKNARGLNDIIKFYIMLMINIHAYIIMDVYGIGPQTNTVTSHNFICNGNKVILKYIHVSLFGARAKMLNVQVPSDRNFEISKK